MRVCVCSFSKTNDSQQLAARASAAVPTALAVSQFDTSIFPSLPLFLQTLSPRRTKMS